MGKSIKGGSANKFIRSKFFQHFVFWCIVFVYISSGSWQFKKDLPEVMVVSFFELLIQMAMAYTVIYVLNPRFLDRSKKLIYSLCIVLLTFLAHLLFSVYLNYDVLNGPDYDAYAGFLERMSYGYGYVTTFVSYFTPTMVLMVFNYYRQQKEVARLLEQKRTSELDALRNQLNPHFLFNTLNNLYTLSLKKSDSTPEVIAKLSEILDYILYRCDQHFVSLAGEMALLHNYIALEKVRYGKRVEVVFNEEVKGDVYIAPLLLLTFLENAFKHGVKEELNTAQISIRINADAGQVDFEIVNSKPQIAREGGGQSREAIGLSNIQKQLDLLYANRHQLDIEETDHQYKVHLSLISNEL